MQNNTNNNTSSNVDSAQPQNHDIGKSLRNYATVLLSAFSLVGCSPEPPTHITAEQFRTNFAKYADRKVEFLAYARQDVAGTNKYGGKVYQVDFFSDPEHSLKVASTVSNKELDRPTQLVTVPVNSVNQGRGVNIDWLKAKFSPVEDPNRPVDTTPVDRVVKRDFGSENR